MQLYNVATYCTSPITVEFICELNGGVVVKNVVICVAELICEGWLSDVCVGVYHLFVY